LIQATPNCAPTSVLQPLDRTSTTDEEDARLLVRHDDDAMRALYRRYERRLYGFGLRLLGGNPGLAEELVQESFTRLWQSARRFDRTRGTVRALLFTIARRVAADLLRRPSSRAFAPEIEDAAAFDARADEILLSVTVRDAMMSLSPVHREVLELIYDEDLKLGEIACKLDVPLGTVKTRAFYALRAMRVALRERGFDE
jgi:RNA polymerase sigma-70 factor, ECF subfamily